MQGVIGTDTAAVFDSVASAANLGAALLASRYYPQVKILDFFSLTSASETAAIDRGMLIIAPVGMIVPYLALLPQVPYLRRISFFVDEFKNYTHGRW